MSDDSILSIASQGSILSIGSVGSVGSVLSIGCTGCVASVLSFASRRSLLSANAVDSALGRPMGRSQRKAFGLGLILLGRVLLRD